MYLWRGKGVTRDGTRTEGVIRGVTSIRRGTTRIRMRSPAQKGNSHCSMCLKIRHQRKESRLYSATRVLLYSTIGNHQVKRLSPNVYMYLMPASVPYLLVSPYLHVSHVAISVCAPCLSVVPMSVCAPCLSVFHVCLCSMSVCGPHVCCAPCLYVSHVSLSPMSQCLPVVIGLHICLCPHACRWSLVSISACVPMPACGHWSPYLPVSPCLRVVIGPHICLCPHQDIYIPLSVVLIACFRTD